MTPYLRRRVSVRIIARTACGGFGGISGSGVERNNTVYLALQLIRQGISSQTLQRERVKQRQGDKDVWYIGQRTH